MLMVQWMAVPVEGIGDKIRSATIARRPLIPKGRLDCSGSGASKLLSLFADLHS